nr:predicted GPI-anchored protein 58 [Aegilops tauschii subsp. strangulata]
MPRVRADARSHLTIAVTEALSWPHRSSAPSRAHSLQSSSVVSPSHVRVCRRTRLHLAVPALCGSALAPAPAPYPRARPRRCGSWSPVAPHRPGLPRALPCHADGASPTAPARSARRPFLLLEQQRPRPQPPAPDPSAPAPPFLRVLLGTAHGGCSCPCPVARPIWPLGHYQTGPTTQNVKKRKRK